MHTISPFYHLMILLFPTKSFSFYQILLQALFLFAREYDQFVSEPLTPFHSLKSVYNVARAFHQKEIS